jgi:hypothetical protein
MIQVATVLGEDGEPTNDTVSVDVRVGAARGSVLITEIMYAPVGHEPEWIELLNVGRDTVNLTGWNLSDHNLSKKAIVGRGESFVAPGQFVVVARDSSFLAIHSDVDYPFFTAEFSPLNNTTPDGPLLFSDQGLTMDSVRYDPSWGGANGTSLERIDTDEPSTHASTWTPSIDPAGSTPGRENSTARLAYDLSILSVTPTNDGLEGIPSVGITVLNAGSRAMHSYDVYVFDDRNDDLYPDQDEGFGSLRSQGTLLPDDSARYDFQFTLEIPGKHSILAEVRSEVDQRTANNRGRAVLWIGSPLRALIINEVLYEPLPGSCEWVEFHNSTSVDANIEGWTLSDAATSSGSVNKFVLSLEPHLVRPGDYVVVAADSTILSFFPHLGHPIDGVHVFMLGRSAGLGLGNDGDAVTLRDLTGGLIDSLAYEPSMHHPHVLDVRGRSLERIHRDGRTNDRRNWSTASGPDGGSPGWRNTIDAIVVPSSATLTIQPNPFSPDCDGLEDFCIISIFLPFPTGTLRVRVFDTRGRMVRTLAVAENVGASAQVIWDGLGDGGGRVPIGPYIVLVEATDPLSGARMVRKAVAVVATRL